jgi:hypothetical protein
MMSSPARRPMPYCPNLFASQALPEQDYPGRLLGSGGYYLAILLSARRSVEVDVIDPR